MSIVTVAAATDHTGILDHRDPGARVLRARRRIHPRIARDGRTVEEHRGALCHKML